ncbi:response regulator transcription factor [Gordonibacter sp.]|uniref:response regulator transcription factor n=1 Tax=Gordonibacter sp. TaxID=1968902 RepID=UPI003FA592F5
MRESEVLLLLAQRKSISVIEKELFIANGTAKAHVRHIYQKLEVHSREELFDLVGES